MSDRHRCGCEEYGGDCTRTTMCHVQLVEEEYNAIIERLRAALEHIGSHFGSAEQCRELAHSALEGDDE